MSLFLSSFTEKWMYIFLDRMKCLWKFLFVCGGTDFHETFRKNRKNEVLYSAINSISLMTNTLVLIISRLNANYSWEKYIVYFCNFLLNFTWKIKDILQFQFLWRGNTLFLESIQPKLYYLTMFCYFSLGKSTV